MLASELIVSSGAACIIAQSKAAWCAAAKRRIDMIYTLWHRQTHLILFAVWQFLPPHMHFVVRAFTGFGKAKANIRFHSNSFD
jgi:hypothetical protein